eukprot:COSAG05_NODE_6317_length_981_cov_2.278912_1_plen_119_part_01
MYLSVWDRLGGSYSQLWRLPRDGKLLKGVDFDAMLRRCCARYGFAPPPKFVYSSHSSRSGAQSAAAAIGVTITTIRRCGGYSKDSRVPEQKYIDPTCPPTPAGRKKCKRHSRRQYKTLS